MNLTNLQDNIPTYFSCFIVYGLINNILYKLIEYYYKTKYKEHRLKYISKNISKSLILFYICIYGSTNICKALIYDDWNNNFIYYLGILYSSHDILSLFMFNNILSSTTKLHHKSVLILSLANLFVDYSKPTIWRGLVAYAYYSALAFYVNTFLGIRFLIKKEKTFLISKLAFLTYLASCTINWLYQIYYFYNFYTVNYVHTIIYISLASMLLNDDIVLLKFLLKY